MQKHDSTRHVTPFQKVSALLFVILLPSLAYFAFTMSPPHHDLDDLETVVGPIQSVDISTPKRGIYRPSLTHVTINGVRYQLHGAFDLEQFRRSREDVRLFVDEEQHIWILQTRERTLITYASSAKRHRRQRLIFNGFGLIMLFGFFYCIFEITRRSVKTGSMFITPK